MEIVGIEVIRVNSLVETRVPAGEPVELTYGETLRVNTSFDYRGPAGKTTLYGAIGRRGLPEAVGFDEKVKGQASIPLPKSTDTFTTVPASVDIGITAAIKPGTDYDLYCKLLEYPGAGMPEIDNIINITGIPPTFRLIQHTIYPSYYIYDGKVEVSTFTATISPFAPSGWAAERFAQEVKKRVEAKGADVIEVKVYVNVTPLLWTEIKIELTATPIAGTTSVGEYMTTGAFPIVGAIILAVLIIVGIIVLTWSITSVIKEFKHFLKEVNWLPWVLGGVGVLAVGGIAAVALSRKRA